MRSISRRDFIGTGLTALAGAALLGTGCSSGGDDTELLGGGAAPGGPGGPPPVAATGTVNLAEVGGQNLSVLAFNQPLAPVGGSGEFTTGVSSQGGQLLFLQDGDGLLRALSFSLPDLQAREDLPLRAEVLSFGAESTALTLVLLVRGILTVVPAELAERVAEIRALASFAALRQAVQSSLKTLSLDELAPQLRSLIEDVARDWLGSVQARVEPVPPIPENGNIGLELLNQDLGLNELQVRFTNNSWRFVSLIRQDLDAGDQEVPPLRLPVVEGVANPSDHRNIMPAANGASWGGIFTNQFLTPATGFERTPLDQRPSVKKIRYYAYGPGNGLNSVDFPPGVTPDMIHPDAFGLTIFYFGLLPVIDFVLGVQSPLDEGVDTIVSFWQNIVGHGISLDNVRLAFESGDAGNIASSIGDLFSALFLLGANTVAGAFLSATAAAAVSVLVAFGTATTIFFAATNWLAAALTWLVLPLVSRVTIDTPPRTDYELVYRYMAPEPFPFVNAHQFGHVAVSTAGILVFNDYELIDLDPGTKRQKLYRRDASGGELTLVEDFPILSVSKDGTTDQDRLVDINDDGDVAWEIQQPQAIGEWFVRLLRQGAAPFNLPRPDTESQFLLGVPGRDGAGQTTVYFMRSDSPVFEFGQFRTGEGAARLPLDQFVNDFWGPYTLRMNNRAFGIGAYDTQPGGEGNRVIFLLQMPLADGTPASYTELRRLTPGPFGGATPPVAVIVNDNGDYAYFHGFPVQDPSSDELIIQRNGQPALVFRATDDVRFNNVKKLAMNQNGDVFVLTDAFSLLKIPAGSSEVVDLTSILPIDADGTPALIEDIAVSGAFLAATTDFVDANREVLLFREI